MYVAASVAIPPNKDAPILRESLKAVVESLKWKAIQIKVIRKTKIQKQIEITFETRVLIFIL